MADAQVTKKDLTELGLHLEKKIDVAVQDLSGIIKAFADSVSQKFEETDERLDSISADMNTVKSDIVEIKSDIVEIKSDIVEIKSDINNVYTELTKINARLDRLEAEVKALHEDIKELYDADEKARKHLNRLDDEIVEMRGWIQLIAKKTGVRLLHNGQKEG